MRNWKQRTLSLMMSAAMLCGCVVSVGAAGDDTYYNRIDADTLWVNEDEGYSIENIKWLNEAGQSVGVTTETIDEEDKNVYKDVVRMELTLENAVENEQYVVLLLFGGEEVPTKDNIWYIDQNTGDVTFNIYPNQLDGPGEYNVVVSSVDEKVTAATFEVLEPPYVLGDVDGDGDVTSNDAGKVLRAVAKLDALSSTQEMAADADGDGDVTSNDAGKILRVVAKLDSFSKT